MVPSRAQKLQITRKIPAVMFSQHPDHAAKPYWHSSEFIKTHDELKECFLVYNQLGGDEVMWDWEGKLVDEAVIERLLGSHSQFFQKHPIGKDVFLTFRVPNPRVEPGYRLGRAFMVILSGQQLAHSANFAATPLFEVILPMTESAKELIEVQKSYQRFLKAATSSFGSNGFGKKIIEVIPIFESVDIILNSGNIIKTYAKLFQKQFKQKLLYLRPFCARSDPALNSGIVPTTLAVKWALSEYAKFTKQTGIPTFPIIAPGSLPFRGGLTPQNTQEFLEEFKGVSTIVIQSSFRYDYPLALVKKAIKQIQANIAKSKTKILPESYLPEIQTIIPWFEKPYKETVEKMAPLIKKISLYIPQRRERVQHIGLFGYSRQVGKLKLPRAIGFAACCYSLGIPPELLGTGRGLRRAKQEGKLKLLESLYLQLKPSLIRAGNYLSKENLRLLGISGVKEDVEAIEEYLGQKLGPKTAKEKKHEVLTREILLKIKFGRNPQEEIEQAAILRQSLG